MKNLKLEQPVVCFDLETTGTSIDRDRIVEIGMIRVETDGTRREYRTLVNPEMPIPPQAAAIHGITDEKVAGAPLMASVVADVAAFLEDADLAGFNSINFDTPILENEMKRGGYELDLHSRRHIDAMRIFHKMEPRTLGAAFKKYCGGDIENAHSALADVSATLDVLDAMVGLYDELEDNIEFLHQMSNENAEKYADRSRKFIWNEQGQACFTFGKYRDRSLQEVIAENRGYLEWMLGKDFGNEVAGILREALDGKFPKKD